MRLLFFILTTVLLSGCSGNRFLQQKYTHYTHAKHKTEAVRVNSYTDVSEAKAFASLPEKKDTMLFPSAGNEEPAVREIDQRKESHQAKKEKRSPVLKNKLKVNRSFVGTTGSKAFSGEMNMTNTDVVMICVMLFLTFIVAPGAIVWSLILFSQHQLLTLAWILLCAGSAWLLVFLTACLFA